MRSVTQHALMPTSDIRYERIERWGDGIATIDTAGVGVDSQGLVYVLARSADQPVTVLDSSGNQINSWGAGRFCRAHALFIGPGDCIYCVDDEGHSVQKFCRDGSLLMEINTADHPADTGFARGTPQVVSRSGPPFNRPTGVAISPERHILISDGYGNARVHHFTADGILLHSFGEPGHGPGQFYLPHGLAVDRDGHIYVADRENNRVQVFESDGVFVTEWWSPRASSIAIDSMGTVFVTEMGQVMQGAPGHKYLDLTGARPKVTVRNRHGEILGEILPPDPESDGLYFAPHSIALDAAGNVYVAEVSTSYSGGLASPGRPRIHKFERIS